jgi:hypothetical protein
MARAGPCAISTGPAVKVALVYPPSCDPTAPYLSLPTLTAWLRKHGVEVLPIDANLEAWEHILSHDTLASLASRMDARIRELEQKSSLSHQEQLDYAALWNARGHAAEAPHAIADALATFRNASRFYDRAAYARAVDTVDAAMRVVSAAYAPLSLDFVAYRTPFSLTSPDEIARDAAPEQNPFFDYFATLADRLASEDVGLVGISVAFPGQIQAAFSLAHALRERMPDLHVTVGGPALTQMLLRLTPETQARVLGPFSSAVVYEGELALLDLVRALERGESPRGVIKGRTIEDMSVLPPPDFDGLPLDRYLTPELVLPYDPTRGCYWGVCTFCHYGLAEVGTARYRERPTATVLDHLEALKKKHGTRVFYLSQDVFSPRIASAIARGISSRGLDIRWGTDMRPERALTLDRCMELAKGGALSTALGVESAAPRVLSLIDKGIPAEDVKNAVKNLSAAGIAVEAMCFSDFPTETYREAMQTVGFVRDLEDDLALFILGRFDLTHGSLVAQKPGEFGIKEVWHVEGDELRTGLFWKERKKTKNAAQQAKLEEEIGDLSGSWQLRRYPWAGALSTAHTMLYYARFGKDVFKSANGSAVSSDDARRPAPRVLSARYDVARLDEESAANEAAIWDTLVHERRCIGRTEYESLAAQLPTAKPAPGLWKCSPGGGVSRVPEPKRGRRQSHAVNATKA